MANLNFPPATPGVPGPEYTLNGIVYYWDGEKWTANTEEGFTGVFVDVTGDNMTGDLTLGTDPDNPDITLSVDGSASFDSYLLLGDAGSSTEWATNFNNGVVQTYVGSAINPAEAPIFLGGRKDGTTSVANVEINADGSAVFAGVTRIGDPDNADPTSADASGVRISNAGLIKIKKSAGGGALSVIDENDGTNAYIGSNGNADFAGNVKIGNYNPNTPDAADLGVYGFASGSLWINSNAVNSPVFIARKDNIDRVLLNSDGSASFAGNVFIGDDCNISGTDGSANFAGGDIQFFDGGAAIFNGAVNVYRDTGSNAGLIVGLNGDNKTILKAEGSAEFEKGIWVSKTETTAYLNCSNYGPANTAVITVLGAGGSNNIILRAGGDIDANNVTFKLAADNDAYYTATTDAEGNETRIYNGPTLDVKAVIQDLQQRVNDRDAVIADLTTRIQTLEGGNN